MQDQFDIVKSDFYILMRKIHQAKPVACVSIEGLTHGELMALHAVLVVGRSCAPAAVRPSVMAEHMHVSPSALSQVVKSLEEKGLLAREREACDCRAVSLCLTEQGQRYADEIEARLTAQARAVVEHVGYEDFSHMLKTLEKIHDFQMQFVQENTSDTAGNTNSCSTFE